MALTKNYRYKLPERLHKPFPHFDKKKSGCFESKMDQDSICSLCLKTGINFMKDDDIQKFKECLDFNDIVIDEKNAQICGLCIDNLNRLYSQYLNAKSNSNIFVDVSEIIKMTGKTPNSDSELPDLSFFGDKSPNFNTGNETVLYKCEICDAMEDDLDTHYILKHSDERNKSPAHDCPQCDSTFLNRFDLRKHLDGNHPNYFLFKCDLCDRFKTNHHQTLAAHVRKEHQKPNKVAIVKPMKRKSPVKEKKVRPCPQCKMSFKKFELNRHMDEEHPGHSLYSCESCSFKTNYGQTMAAHKRRNQCIEYMLEEMFGADTD